jgi:hypothetical protein
MGISVRATTTSASPGPPVAPVVARTIGCSYYAKRHANSSTFRSLVHPINMLVERYPACGTCTSSPDPPRDLDAAAGAHPPTGRWRGHSLPTSRELLRYALKVPRTIWNRKTETSMPRFPRTQPRGHPPGTRRAGLRGRVSSGVERGSPPNNERCATTWMMTSWSDPIVTLQGEVW